MQVAWTHEGLGEVNLSAAWTGAQGQYVWKESPRESGVSGLGSRTEFLFIDGLTWILDGSASPRLSLGTSEVGLAIQVTSDVTAGL